MKNVGSSTNRIESDPDGINQQTVLRVSSTRRTTLLSKKSSPISQPVPPSGVITMSIWPTPVRQ